LQLYFDAVFQLYIICVGIPASPSRHIRFWISILYTFVGLFIMALFFTSFALLADKYILLLRPVDSPREIYIISLLIWNIHGSGSLLTSSTIRSDHLYNCCFHFQIMALIRKKGKSQYNFPLTSSGTHFYHAYGIQVMVIHP